MKSSKTNYLSSPLSPLKNGKSSTSSSSQHDNKDVTPPTTTMMAAEAAITATAPTTISDASSTSAAAWGSLRPPTAKDICPRKRHRGLDAPPPMLDYLIVLDFEWTADNKKKMIPISEITQFPSVAMKLNERNKKKKVVDDQPPIPPDDEEEEHHDSKNDDILLPVGLTMPCNWPARQDAIAVSAFDTFVRPIFNPKLTRFSIELTAITQQQVDTAPTVDVVLKKYIRWLSTLGLVDENAGQRKENDINWCFVTWGDVDIMETLRVELQYKAIELPPCFDRWINLKSDSMFKRHYGREPRGGLRACVESVGAKWEGRAHNGLVDSFNTAKIVKHMVQTGFRFTRPTRGIGKDGIPFGQKKQQKQR